ncbi:hypothetical protein Godav_017606, partial [Gossypium davidsonii]|nr:hypothetical protein [Gossypium davidsonii]MBA0639872.1 hypothetical protein [Gossypium klotzschianum]
MLNKTIRRCGGHFKIVECLRVSLSDTMNSMAKLIGEQVETFTDRATANDVTPWNLGLEEACGLVVVVLDGIVEQIKEEIREKIKEFKLGRVVADWGSLCMQILARSPFCVIFSNLRAFWDIIVMPVSSFW